MNPSTLFAFVFTTAFLSCPLASSAKDISPAPSTDSSQEFFTEKVQDSFTPESMLAELKERNRQFVEGAEPIHHTKERIEKAAHGQHPGAVILSCLDSRVPVEDVFHSGIGDLFVLRVGGNVATPEVLGGLEYACEVAGSKVIIVMGHSGCGAVKAAIDNVELGNITSMVQPIREAVEDLSDFEGEKTSKNPEFVEAVCRENIQNVIEDIRTQSPILQKLENAKEILIVGAEYNLHSGEVLFFDK